MKRLYSVIAIAIMMLVSFTASAQVKSLEMANGTLTRTGDAKAQTADFSRVRKHASVSENALTASSMAKAPAKAASDGTWTSIGTGSYREVIVGGWFGIDAQDYDVDIQQCNETPGYYRMANPYQAYKNANGGTYTASQADAYLYIHAENPEQVYLEPFNTGWSGNVSSYGYVTIADQVGHYVAAGYSLETIVNALGSGYFGKLQDGVITFPENALLTTMTNYNSGGYYYADSDGNFRIVLPGTEVKDYSIKVVAEACNADNKVNFTLTAGDDVAAIKYGVFNGNVSANAEPLLM